MSTTPALQTTNGTGSGGSKIPGVAVYCGASLGKHAAYQEAALSVGRAIAAAGRPLIYGGGNKGLMGTASGAALLSGGKVVAVAPYAILRTKGGEGRSMNLDAVDAEVRRALEIPRDTSNVELIVVDSMHERKVVMAKRVGGFIGLPGGFGTFEEVMEVTTWTQLGIHQKPTVLLNVRGFYTHLREQIFVAQEAGFISEANLELIRFVDCPTDQDDETFDWGNAALQAIDSWKPDVVPLFDWTVRMGEGEKGETRGSDALQST
ncbi:hypothetical protein BDV98DRAFT_558531 [Pterulicium gracile]|uniref:Lysine decarboxylase-like protein n=1 Tax=Pterulicium gracile TaxID=1884261 RepID=A0A5C3R2D2_9AGAR|nr:hypothetical protein BDV98DRAFT_558531 [Pterula gracilis]